VSENDHILQRLQSWLSNINEAVGRAISWLTLCMVVVTFLVVVLRYAFNLGWIAMQESVTYMHALVFLLGAAYTLKHDGHVRVDIFYRRLSQRGRAWVDLLGALLLLWPVCMYITWVSWDYIASSWEVHEASGEAGGLPGVYLLKTTIVIMTTLVAIQGTVQVLRSLLIIRGIEIAGTQDGEASREI
jgi:TRAP-type mannitol/chloroaromatic compound transport system permease small subunit